MLKGFKEFIMRGNVIDLAVAVIMGAAFNQVVNSLVADVLTPLIGALFGARDYSALRLGPVVIGNFINAVANFLIVSSVLYFFIVAPMNAIKKRQIKEKEKTPAEPTPSEEVKLLGEILERLKNM